jgi:hypothetical protein
VCSDAEIAGSAAIRSSVSSSGSSRRPASTTLNPSRANASADARPIPVPAPVINATRMSEP